MLFTSSVDARITRLRATPLSRHYADERKTRRKFRQDMSSGRRADDFLPRPTPPRRLLARKHFAAAASTSVGRRRPQQPRHSDADGEESIRRQYSAAAIFAIVSPARQAE